MPRLLSYWISIGADFALSLPSPVTTSTQLACEKSAVDAVRRPFRRLLNHSITGVPSASPLTPVPLSHHGRSIAGITGLLGQRLARAALDRGLAVRGLGRSPDKLDPTIAASLEAFVQMASHEDIPALDKAVAGVDSIINAYSPIDVLSLDGSLLLLRAAERAGIKVFIACSWNYDWTRMKYGALEHYDTCIAFEHQAALTSTIRPVYLFTGIFSSYMLSPFAPGAAVVGPEKTVFRYWGDDGLKTKHPWVTQDDAAVYTIDVLLHGKGVQDAQGGFFHIPSGRSTIAEIAEAYGRVSGKPYEVEKADSLDELRQQVDESRKRLGRGRAWDYASLAMQLESNSGIFEMADEQLYDVNKVKTATTLDDALRPIV
ncbi:hypothetical protein HYQ45_008088 [Verticillium longisporum]|nr:hypothetical protein HYQ45_008088 [Verticillium longisporum]CRK34769.1 hypothetical protein BN1708_006505 [Verticillium longisporum]